MHTRISITDEHKQAACNSCPWTGDAHPRSHVDVDFNARWDADLHDMEHRMNTTLTPEEQALAALGEEYLQARNAAEDKRQALKRAVRAHLAAGQSEQRVAMVAGIDRMTVRKWRAQYELEHV